MRTIADLGRRLVRNRLVIVYMDTSLLDFQAIEMGILFQLTRSSMMFGECLHRMFRCQRSGLATASRSGEAVSGSAELSKMPSMTRCGSRARWSLEKLWNLFNDEALLSEPMWMMVIEARDINMGTACLVHTYFILFLHILHDTQSTTHDEYRDKTSATFSRTPCFPSYFSSKLASASSAFLPLISRRISSSLGSPIQACGYSL